MTQLFSVAEADATRLEQITLAEVDLMERAHLQEWVITHPEVLGDDVLIVASEYDRWSGTGGVRTRDRLDILGLDIGGRLLVVELKRDAASTDVHLQGITYAALVSRFTLETLASAHAEWLTRERRHTDFDTARAALLEHAGELDADLLRRPRIVIIASSFPRQVTHTAVWLSEMGVEIELTKVTAWRSGSEVLAGFTKLWPTPALDGFMLGPTMASDQVTRKVEQRTRAAAAVRRLIDAGVLEDGTKLHLVPQHGVTAAQRLQVSAWLAEQEQRDGVSWRNDASGPLAWDGRKWLPTSLARHVLEQATGEAGDAIRGTTWFVDEAGRSLADLAEAIPGHVSRDWSDLHAVLDALPAGSWTTYGDLAQVVGTGAQALARHLTTCPNCPSAYRVLVSGGRVATGFSWGDPGREEDPVQVLTDEGVLFSDGVADAEQRLGPDRLAALVRANA